MLNDEKQMFTPNTSFKVYLGQHAQTLLKANTDTDDLSRLQRSSVTRSSRGHSSKKAQRKGLHEALQLCGQSTAPFVINW